VESNEQQDYDAFAVSHDASFDDTWCHVARAAVGLEQYLHPDFSKILNAQVWIDAFGQAFFSLSVPWVSTVPMEAICREIRHYKQCVYYRFR